MSLGLAQLQLSDSKITKLRAHTRNANQLDPCIRTSALQYILASLDTRVQSTGHHSLTDEKDDGFTRSINARLQRSLHQPFSASPQASYGCWRWIDRDSSDVMRDQLGTISATTVRGQCQISFER